jgi:hypothetical protein
MHIVALAYLCISTDSFQHYRLGDIVKGTVDPRLDPCRLLARSIGCRYLESRSGKNNITTLRRLVTEQAADMPWLAPDSAAVYLHVRLGDAITGPDCFNNQANCRGSTSTGQLYAFPESCYNYDSFKARMANQTVVIVGTREHNTKDARHTKLVRWSGEYIHQLSAWLRSVHATPVVAVTDSLDPASVDRDFVAMASASVFVAGGGGFSRLVAAVVRARNKTVIVPNCPRTCQKFDVLVSSQGGVGSSKFMEMLAKTGAHCNSPRDADRLKHLSANHYTFDKVVTAFDRIDPSNCAVARRLLVVVGDVPHAVGSVYRRFGVAHINKLRQNAGWKPVSKATFDNLGVFNLTESAMPYYQHSWAGVVHSLVKVVDTKTLYSTNQTIIEWLLPYSGVLQQSVASHS